MIRLGDCVLLDQEIQERVEEKRVTKTKIRSLVGTECWRFVPDEVNPTDLATGNKFINDVMIKRCKKWT